MHSDDSDYLIFPKCVVIKLWFGDRLMHNLICFVELALTVFWNSDWHGPRQQSEFSTDTPTLENRCFIGNQWWLYVPAQDF